MVSQMIMSAHVRAFLPLYPPLWVPVFCVSLLLAGCEQEGSGMKKAAAPRDAFNFTLPDLAGRPHALNEYLQKGPVMLVFFTTWCSNCKKEIPALKQVYREYSERNLQLLAINAGLADNLENAQRYALQNRLPYAVLFDAGGEVAARYGVRSVPKIFYLRQDGTVSEVSRQVSRLAIATLLRTQ